MKMNLNIKILIFIFSFFIAQQGFSQKPDWISVSDLLVESTQGSELDFTKLSLTFNRCSGLRLSISRLMRVDTPDLADGQTQIAVTFIQASTIASLLTAIDRGNTNPNIEEFENRAQNAVNAFMSIYDGWLDSNYITSGSYWDKDIDLQNEITSCIQAEVYAKEFLSL